MRSSRHARALQKTQKPSRRTLSAERLLGCASVPGVVLVSLQKGAAAAQLKATSLSRAVHDWTEELNDFADTAALIEALDLVISVDTAAVHLAGALGKPVWLLNRFDTCWRWLLGRDDSPWYPTLHQFRQPRAGDWEGVLGRVGAALAEEAARISPPLEGLGRESDQGWGEWAAR